MFQLFLLTAYTFIFSFIIYRRKFFRQFEIKTSWIAFLFIVRVIIGILYGELHILPQGRSDTWALFQQGSWQVYHVLFINPANYLKLVFLPCSIPPPHGLEHYAHSIAAYSNENLYFLVRFHAIVRLVSFGFYNVHVVFYNFVTLIGILYLVKFVKQFVQGKDILILLSLALLPAVAFWTSGMHKDGFGLAAFGIFLYSLLNILRKDLRMKNFAALVLSIFLLAVLRGFVFVIMVPAIIAFAWTYKKPNHSLLKFILVHLVYFGIVFNIYFISPELNVFEHLTFVQQEFLNLEVTHSTISLSRLDPNISSLISLVPEGIAHCLFRPYLWEMDSLSQWIYAMDNVLLILFSAVTLIFFRTRNWVGNSFFLLCFFYAISLFALVGILVPNLGALSRYKTTGVLFWIFMMLFALDWQAVKTYFKSLRS